MLRFESSFGVAVVCFFFTLLGDSRADERIGAFFISDDVKTAILFDGEIGTNTPLEFRRAMAMRPDAKLLVLASPGGWVGGGLLIADDVHRLGLSTLIPEGRGCYSACSFVFLAGVERLAEGELGVHQMSSSQPSAAGIQATVSDILEALEKFDTPTLVITRMFRTPSEDMYVFSPQEIQDLGIDRLGPTVLENVPDKWAASADAPTKSKNENPDPSAPAGSLQLAIYGGLDFYGADVGKSRESDAVSCAMACLQEKQCVAFTFNANPKLKSGPNCFLKDGIDRPEAYSDALSGLFLVDGAKIPVFSFGAIDPTEDVTRNFDYPGNDLSQRPTSARSLAACRTSCIERDDCAAFSYVVDRRQCWLKEDASAGRRKSGITSGVKRQVTFSPIDVLDLTE